MKAKVDWARRNWELALQIVIVGIFTVLLVVDHFGGATLASGTIGTTIVALLFFAAIRITRQGDEVRSRLNMQSDELRKLRDMQLSAVNVHEVPGDQIAAVLRNMLGRSDSWHFRGGSGRWQLKDVLPRLSEIRDKDAVYVMQIINPLDEHLCSRYGQYRAKSRTFTQAPSLAEATSEVRADILACIYAAGWYKHKYRVRPEITFLQSYSPIRVDGGASGLMVTIADPGAPGLWAAKGSWFYKSTLDELEQLKEVSLTVVLPSGPEVNFPVDLANVTAGEVRQMLETVHVKDSAGSSKSLSSAATGNIFTSLDFDTIAEKVRNTG